MLQPITHENSRIFMKVGPFCKRCRRKKNGCLVSTNLTRQGTPDNALSRRHSTGPTRQGTTNAVHLTRVHALTTLFFPARRTALPPICVHSQNPRYPANTISACSPSETSTNKESRELACWVKHGKYVDCTNMQETRYTHRI